MCVFFPRLGSSVLQWNSIRIRPMIAPLDRTTLAGTGKDVPVKRLATKVAIITPTDRPTSVRNRCVRELFGRFDYSRRFNIIPVISRLGNGLYLISESTMVRAGLEPQIPCSANKELFKPLNHRRSNIKLAHPFKMYRVKTCKHRLQHQVNVCYMCDHLL